MKARLSHPWLVPLWLGLAAAVLAAAAALSLPDRRDTLLMLDLQTNHVQFKVSQPGTALVVVREGWLRRQAECDGPRDVSEDGDAASGGAGQGGRRLLPGPDPLAALLAPAAGTLVEYIWQPRSLLLRYAPPPGQAGPFLTVMRQGEPDCDISRDSLVVTLPHAALAAMAPLPVVGTGSIGRVILDRAPPSPRNKAYLPGTDIEDLPSPGNFLHGGTIRVYARADTTPPSIFPVADAAFEVPRNSRVDFGPSEGRDPAEEPTLRGWAMLDPAGRGLSLHAVTSASDVTIAGVGGVTAIAAGTLAVAVNDPANVRLLTGLAVFIFLFPTLISVWQLVRDQRGES